MSVTQKRDIDLIREHLPELTGPIRSQAGGLTGDQVRSLASNDGTRLVKVLVRCGCGRFVCPAQDVMHFADIIENEASDYVRDFSLPVGGE